jgi:hypothetical protein
MFAESLQVEQRPVPGLNRQADGCPDACLQCWCCTTYSNQEVLPATSSGQIVVGHLVKNVAVLKNAACKAGKAHLV